MNLLDQIGDDRYKWIDGKNLDAGFTLGSSNKPGSPTSLRSSSYYPSFNFSNILLFEEFLGSSHCLKAALAMGNLGSHVGSSAGSSRNSFQAQAKSESSCLCFFDGSEGNTRGQFGIYFTAIATALVSYAISSTRRTSSSEFGFIGASGFLLHDPVK